jgi:hypothetical protein
MDKNPFTSATLTIKFYYNLAFNFENSLFHKPFFVKEAIGNHRKCPEFVDSSFCSMLYLEFSCHELQ